MSRLKSLMIQNFKCFRNLEVEFGALTVLSGVNGGGKSTVAESILLLSQAIGNSSKLHASPPKGWPLNGKLIRLGTTHDVICRPISEKFLQLGFETSDHKHTFNLSISKDDSRCLVNNDLDSDLISKFGQISKLAFISANRWVLDEFPVPKQSDYSNVGVGIDGRFASYWFNGFESKKISESRCLAESNADNFFQNQLNAWLGTIIPGAKARAKVTDSNNELALEFEQRESSDYFKPANAGYGITNVFPILVALLAAETNALIIIDRPEAHLHASAQSELGQMIAQIASAGVQIIIETHSEHVLNGIRIGVLKEKIEPADVNILFFSGGNEFGNGLISLEMDNKATINQWPEGFFDQIDNDLATLLNVV